MQSVSHNKTPGILNLFMYALLSAGCLTSLVLSHNKAFIVVCCWAFTFLLLTVSRLMILKPWESVFWQMLTGMIMLTGIGGFYSLSTESLVHLAAIYLGVLFIFGSSMSHLILSGKLHHPEGHQSDKVNFYSTVCGSGLMLGSLIHLVLQPEFVPLTPDLHNYSSICAFLIACLYIRIFKMQPETDIA